MIDGCGTFKTRTLDMDVLSGKFEYIVGLKYKKK